MKTQIHSIKFDADQKLIDFIERRLNKLQGIYERITSVEVFLKLNNLGVENKTVEIKVNLPGSQLFSKHEAKSFEEAADSSLDSVRRQLTKLKEKRQSH